MNLPAFLFGGCWTHDPIKVLKGKTLHFECFRCHADLGAVLPKQKLKVRKERRVLSMVKARKRA